MGTNFYWVNNEISNIEDGIHIGKSSAGWCFSLHVYETIPDWSTWSKLLRCYKDECRIVNEYGEVIPLKVFYKIVTKRKGPKEKPRSEEMSEYAVPGPNNLLRHKKVEGFCIGWGFGTYDYLVGDFS